jgi:hypothetical protein
MRTKSNRTIAAGLALGIAAILMPAFTAPARAQGQTPVVNRAQRRQEMRIRQGVRSGRLTPRQARRLQRSEARVQVRKAAYKARGPLTPQERAQLRRQGRRISRAERANTQVR